MVFRTALCVFAFVIALSGCGVERIAASLAEGDHYEVKDAQVYWVDWSSMGGPPSRNVRTVDADAATFRAMPDKIYQHTIYGRDASKVFCEGKVLENALPTSFRVLPHPNDNYVEYATDNVRVWSQCEWIEEADGATFSRLEGEYAKDATHVFSNKGVMKDADVETFEVIFVEPKLGQPRYARDRVGVFSGIFRMDLEDPDAFRVIGANYSTDGVNVFWTHYKVEGADPNTFFVPKGMQFGQDKSGCWRGTSQFSC